MRSVVFFKKSGGRGSAAPARGGLEGRRSPPPFRFKGSKKTPPLRGVKPLQSPKALLKPLFWLLLSLPSYLIGLIKDVYIWKIRLWKYRELATTHAPVVLGKSKPRSLQNKLKFRFVLEPSQICAHWVFNMSPPRRFFFFFFKLSE